MRNMFRHHDSILRLIDNADDDVKGAWAAIFALTHAPLKEYIKETRGTFLANI